MKKYRWIAIIAVLVLFIGGGGYLGAGYVIYNNLTPIQAKCSGENLLSEIVDNTPDNFRANYNDRTEIDATPYLMPDYEAVEFSARGDDVTIRGWFIPAATESEDVVIAIHGVTSCIKSSEVLLPAGMLYRNGYNVLLIDMRNHGESDIEDGRTSVGNREYKDVLGAYDWLLTQGFTSGNIGLFGTSLGGATVLNAFGQEQGIAAVWEDSTFADIHDILNDELERSNYPTFMVDAGILVTNLMGIDLLEFSPLESIGNHNNRPVFIVHGTGDTRIKVEYASQLFANAGENAKIWIIEGPDHLQGMYLFPEEYEQKLLDFFDAALRDDESS